MRIKYRNVLLSIYLICITFFYTKLSFGQSTFSVAGKLRTYKTAEYYSNHLLDVQEVEEEYNKWFSLWKIGKVKNDNSDKAVLFIEVYSLLSNQSKITKYANQLLNDFKRFRGYALFHKLQADYENKIINALEARNQLIDVFQLMEADFSLLDRCLPPITDVKNYICGSHAQAKLFRAELEIKLGSNISAFLLASSVLATGTMNNNYLNLGFSFLKIAKVQMNLGMYENLIESINKPIELLNDSFHHPIFFIEALIVQTQALVLVDFSKYAFLIKTNLNEIKKMISSLSSVNPLLKDDVIRLEALIAIKEHELSVAMHKYQQIRDNFGIARVAYLQGDFVYALETLKKVQFSFNFRDNGYYFYLQGMILSQLNRPVKDTHTLLSKSMDYFEFEADRMLYTVEDLFPRQHNQILGSFNSIKDLMARGFFRAQFYGISISEVYNTIEQTLFGDKYDRLLFFLDSKRARSLTRFNPSSSYFDNFEIKNLVISDSQYYNLEDKNTQFKRYRELNVKRLNIELDFEKNESTQTLIKKSAKEPYLKIKKNESLVFIQSFDQVVLTYIIGGKDDTTHFFKAEISKEELSDLVKSYRKALTTEKTEIVLLGKELSNKLLRPLLNQIPEQEHIVFILDPILQQIPFEALPLSGSAYDFLIDRNIVTYVPSLSFLQQRRSDKIKEIDKVFALLNPYFGENYVLKEKESSLGIKGITKIKKRTISDLNYTLKIKKFLDEDYPEESIILEGKNATETNLKSTNLSEFDLVILASHGMKDKGESSLTMATSEIKADESDKIFRNFMNSFIKNSPKSGFITNSKPLQLANDLLASLQNSSNNILQSSEVETLNVKSRLTMLIACSTEDEENLSEEGNLGVGRSFLLSGSKSVLASLWNVYEHPSVELALNIIKPLLKNEKKPLPQIVHEAKLKIKKQYNHPFYWSGFILLGE